MASGLEYQQGSKIAIHCLMPLFACIVELSIVELSMIMLRE